MDLKNAVAVCLISLFSATIVVLIARSVNQQAASQLEPTLAKIAAELEAIRKQGGGVAVQSGTPTPAEHRDGLVVYFFHGKQRCPSCRAIESQAYDVLQKEFAEPFAEGSISWEVVNYEKPSAAAMVKLFEVQMAVVVLAKMNQGKIERWKRLDEVWGLYDEPAKFAQFIRDEIAAMLPVSSSAAAAKPKAEGAGSGEPAASSPLLIPVPPGQPSETATSPLIPIPE